MALPKWQKALRWLDSLSALSQNGLDKRLLSSDLGSQEGNLRWLPVFIISAVVWSSPGNFIQTFLSVLWTWVLAQICDEGLLAEGSYLSVVAFARQWMTPLVAFVLGGFVTLSAARWSRTRSIYTFVCGKTREHLMVVAALFQKASYDCETLESTEMLQAYRDKFGRYAVLALELAIRRAQGKTDSMQTKSWLQKLSLVTNDEWDRMVPDERHSTVYAWLLTASHQASVDGFLSMHEAAEMHTSIKATLGAANEMIDSQKDIIPLPYARVVTILVKSYIAICSTEFGMTIANAKYSQQVRAAVPASYVLLSLVAVYLISSCMQALLDLNVLLHSPFADSLGASSQDVSVNQGLNQLRLELLGRPHDQSCIFNETDWEFVETQLPRDEEEGFNTAMCGRSF
jgi:hypothetical protein